MCDLWQPLPDRNIQQLRELTKSNPTSVIIDQSNLTRLHIIFREQKEYLLNILHFQFRIYDIEHD